METTTYIEDYFENRLSAGERQQFEKRVKEDTAFAREVKEYALMMNAFDELRAEELAERFEELEAESEIPARKSRSLDFSGFLRLAAAILVLAIVSIMVYRSNNDSTKDLFVAYYAPYPNVEHPVSRSGTAEKDVWVYYEQGNYAEASKLFHRALTANEDDLAGWFYLGICELEQNKLKEAEIAFNRVLAKQDNKYADQAAWYLAMSYLKGNQDEKLKNSLKAISSSRSSYREKAGALLAEIQ